VPAARGRLRQKFLPHSPRLKSTNSNAKESMTVKASQQQKMFAQVSCGRPAFESHYCWSGAGAIGPCSVTYCSMCPVRRRGWPPALPVHRTPTSDARFPHAPAIKIVTDVTEPLTATSAMCRQYGGGLVDPENTRTLKTRSPGPVSSAPPCLLPYIVTCDWQ
jgi:hypothetical protein